MNTQPPKHIVSKKEKKALMAQRAESDTTIHATRKRIEAIKEQQAFDREWGEFTH
ncbi:hypothetical protein [Vibrio sp. 10N.261.46.A3]|uniref:hypothetical protein n=1 Tax=Vibrio sp. 10N.261.46.A3 TaxID=3229658 RepID=UPI00354C87EA